MSRRKSINLPGPRWLQFIVIVILADLLILGIVAGSCYASGRCSTVDWSNRMFWGGMIVFGIGLPAIGSSFMGLAGSSGVGTNMVAMSMEASAMDAVVRYEQGAQKKRFKFFVWPFAIGAGAIIISILLSQLNQPVVGAPPDFDKPERSMPAKVAAQFEEETERSISFIPLSGVTMAVWDSKNPVFLKSYGKANEDTNTRYAIGEMTQQFTAAAIFQLIEAGDLSLDGVITAYLPDLPRSYMFIELNHLLTHTGGLASDADVAEAAVAMLGEDPWQSDTAYTADDFMRITQALFPEPLTEPGTAYHFSEQGYRILGMIIEKVSGESYKSYIDNHILSPLEMASTAPCEIDTANLAAGHIVENNRPVEVAFPNTSYAYASGNLCSTVADLMRWQYGLKSHQVITAESLATMYTPAVFEDGKSIKLDNGEFVALGTTVGESSIAGYYTSSAGRLPGYESVLRSYYTQDIIIVVLSDTTVPEFRKNTSNDLPQIIEQVIWAFHNNWLLN